MFTLPTKVSDYRFRTLSAVEGVIDRYRVTSDQPTSKFSGPFSFEQML